MRAAVALAVLASGCADPDLASGLVTAGPPTVSAVLVTGEAGTAPTYCNAAMGDHTPKVCVPGQSVEPVDDVRPLHWSVRIVFKELLDPSIEEIDAAGNGSIRDADPFTVRCGGAPVDYAGFYDPSGNHETSPVGPALVIHAVAEPGAATAAPCVVEINPGSVRDKDGEAAPTSVSFAFTIAPLHVVETVPADGAVDADPAAPIALTLNSDVDGASLAGNVRVTDGLGAGVPAAVGVSPDDPTRIMIEPEIELARAAAYTVTATAGVTDTLGGPLTEATFTFTTRP